jgi:DDE superfamily endonuclease
LAHGTIDAEALRDLLARVPLAGAEDEPPVYAVDVSVWDRCDAETSPERGFYYHPSRHSSGQPIVAGWAYQFIARLNFVRESWTAPVDVARASTRRGTPTGSPPSRRRRCSVGRPWRGISPPCSSSTRATTR